MDCRTKNNSLDLKDKILALKEKKKAVLLAHNYQIPDIQDLADFLGDSLALAKRSMSTAEPLIVCCGVRFMAETAKILSPQKKVILPAADAGCALAQRISVDTLIDLKKRFPDAWVVSYVNTTAQIKALSDVCCTSANAVSVVKNVPSKRVIFVPDRNLGMWVQQNVPDKELILFDGCCDVHDQITLEDVKKARQKYSDAQLLVHPECRLEVLKHADFVLSTSGMFKEAEQSQAEKFIIGTEEGIVYQMQKKNPNKKFYPLITQAVCRDMKKTTLPLLYRALRQEQEEIKIDADIIKQAQRALERMVQYI